MSVFAIFVYAMWAGSLALYIWAVCYAVKDLFRRWARQ